MSGCQRLFAQSQDWLRRKNASTITFGNGFQIFVPFPPCFLFPPFVPLFPLQPLLPPIIPLTSSVLPLSLPVCLARPRALYAQARVDGAGCATIVQKWINNSYAKLKTGSFPHLKTTLLTSRAERRRELAWGLDWWMVYDYFRHGGLTSVYSWLNM